MSLSPNTRRLLLSELEQDWRFHNECLSAEGGAEAEKSGYSYSAFSLDNKELAPTAGHKFVFILAKSVSGPVVYQAYSVNLSDDDLDAVVPLHPDVAQEVLELVRRVVGDFVSPASINPRKEIE